MILHWTTVNFRFFIFYRFVFITTFHCLNTDFYFKYKTDIPPIQPLKSIKIYKIKSNVYFHADTINNNNNNNIPTPKAERIFKFVLQICKIHQLETMKEIANEKKGLKKSNMEQKNKKNNLFNRTLIFKSVEKWTKRKRKKPDHMTEIRAITLQSHYRVRLSLWTIIL